MSSYKLRNKLFYLSIPIILFTNQSCGKRGKPGQNASPGTLNAMNLSCSGSTLSMYVNNNTPYTLTIGATDSTSSILFLLPGNWIVTDNSPGICNNNMDSLNCGGFTNAITIDGITQGPSAVIFLSPGTHQLNIGCTAVCSSQTMICMLEGIANTNSIYTTIVTGQT